MTTTHPVKERVTTIGEGGRRFWLYPAQFRGFWLKRRQWVSVILIALFFVLPWIKINGQQAILLNVADRKFVFFGLVFWPQDLYIFWFFVVAAVVGIFLITAQWGRLWCGWACPQTVFLEHVFRRIERWIEGDATKRKRLDRGPLTWEKIRKKTLKLSIFAAISIHFANTVLCYFAGSDHVVYMTFHAPEANWNWFMFMAFLSFVFFADFAWFREQFCIIACPYGRFQSALLDEHSLIVGYDARRGEPRGKWRKGQVHTSGDCIDCNRCVAVCPTGIDIRMGLQMECVNCTACIDACDEMMRKVNRPEGLIRYTSVRQLDQKNRKAIRPRSIIYSALLLVLLSCGMWALAHKRSFTIQMLRSVGESMRVQDAKVINQFQLKIANQTADPLVLSANVPQEFELITPLPQWKVEPQSTSVVPVFIAKPISEFSHTGKEKVQLQFKQDDQVVFENQVTLIGPSS
ncbi:MAG: cytochrome c oxidase accessory protein CcoG [Acidobacteria bacterium]|nr:cytochrome c oxidase accessory protein CcoG [Acidobacteriota bacterium]